MKDSKIKIQVSEGVFKMNNPLNIVETEKESDSLKTTEQLIVELNENFNGVGGKIQKLEEAIQELEGTKSTSKVSKIISEQSKRRFTILNIATWLALIVMMLFGLGLILVSILIETDWAGIDKHTRVLFVKEIGILLFAVITTTMIHELLLRRKLLAETQEILALQLSDVIGKYLPDKIQEVISNQLPKKYLNIKESGIVDAYANLKTDKTIEKIEGLGTGSEIFILNIWLQGNDKLIPALKKACLAGCKVKIILLHPDEDTAIEKRVKFLDTQTKISIKNRITDNIYFLNLAINEIKNAQKQGKFEVKLHKDFVSVSIFGLDTSMIVGFYLHNRTATENVQLKVIGKDTNFYKSFRENFNTQWNSKSNITIEQYLEGQGRKQI